MNVPPKTRTGAPPTARSAERPARCAKVERSTIVRLAIPASARPEPLRRAAHLTRSVAGGAPWILLE
ncbi:hypothetical protein ABZ490_48030, partial [Streptomyces sp. NPDC005811]|uniref:hypothetical protein n=1 Tax=Streptomyces sp. NPDC005811 TaxID=3154565 RepID=UPI0033EE02D4